MDLLLAGASVRAAAGSAVRAGLRPIGLDWFADRDLVALGPATRIPRSAGAEALEALVAAAPPGPWLYTGPLENSPELVGRLAALRPLWGVAGEPLRAARDPFRVREVLARAGLPAAEVRGRPDGLPRDGRWLTKPRASGGGLGIRPLGPDAPDGASGGSYFQERIAGPSFGAVFVGTRDQVALLGVAAQRIGRLGEPFAYAGSVGPVACGAEAELRQVGRVLGRELGLLGLFGIDFVLAGGVPWVVEVNPRYTASVEVLERATGRLFLAEHARAFGAATGAPPGRPCAAVVGKAILFAGRSGRFPAGLAWRPERHAPCGWAALADVPRPEEPFGAGDPVVSVFARGGSVEACSARLGRALGRWRRRLGLD